jgi:hypothetical protein
VIGDLNHDGKLDIAAALNLGQGIAILLGNGDGTFQISTLLFPRPCFLDSIDIADFDLDGQPDLVTSDPDYVFIDVLLGNGDGTFKTPAQTTYADNRPEFIHARDFNSDGKPDVLVHEAGRSEVTLMVGRGDGTFLPPVSIYRPTNAWERIRGFAVADFNGDTHSDLIVHRFAGGVLLGNGAGAFTPAFDSCTNCDSVESEFRSFSFACVADFDNDGRADVATCLNEADTQTIDVILNRSQPALSAALVPGGIQLRWPNWTGFSLESASNFTRADSWLTVTNHSVVVGSQRELILSAENASAFFRLNDR